MTDIDPTIAQDAAEARRVARLTDAQVLQATNHGQYGPALVGKHLAERSQRIMKATGGGVFGPAITDPDYDKKQRAAAEAGATDPAVDEDDEVDDADEDATDLELLERYAAEAIERGYTPEAAGAIAQRRLLAKREGIPYAEAEKRLRRPAPPAPRAPAAVAPEGPVDPANLSDPRNPWTYVTLSGAKILAQEKQVSYAPRIKRAELIASLQAAGVVPPEIPTDTTDDDEPGA